MLLDHSCFKCRPLLNDDELRCVVVTPNLIIGIIDDNEREFVYTDRAKCKLVVFLSTVVFWCEEKTIVLWV